MAEKSRFFDTALTPEGEFDRQYPAKDYADYFDTLVTTGVFADQLDALAVTGHGTQMKTILATGKAFIKGHYYENDSSLELVHDFPDSSQNRIDLVVLRMDRTMESRHVKAFVIPGTPGGTAPEPIETTDIFEIVLAEVLVIAGKSFIESNEITDKRTYASYQAKPAWYPEGQVPMDAWMYVNFKEELTAQEVVDIEANPSLMEIINNNYIGNWVPEIKPSLNMDSYRWILPGWVVQQATSASLLSVGNVKFTPIYISQDTDFDAYGTYIGTSSSGAVMTGAIYKSENMLPTEKLYDLAPLDCSITGAKIGLLDITLKKGWYFIAVRGSIANVRPYKLDKGYSIPPVSTLGEYPIYYQDKCIYTCVGTLSNPAPTVSDIVNLGSGGGEMVLRKAVL